MRILILSYIFSVSGLYRCTFLKENGEFCKENKECESGLCNDSICDRLPIKSGDICGFGYSCGPGLGCGIDNICRPIAKKGDKCQMRTTGLNLCEKGLLCYNGICDFPKNRNEECSDDKRCSPEYHCSKSKLQNYDICQPKLKKRMPCREDNDCKQGFYCHTKNMKCARLKRKGFPCREGDCKVGLACIPAKRILKFFIKNVCGKIPSEGEPCTDRCQSGLYCGV
jgi:hypothetical protein